VLYFEFKYPHRLMRILQSAEPPDLPFGDWGIQSFRVLDPVAEFTIPTTC